MSTPTCRLIPSGASYQGAQGLTYLAGVTGASAGSRAICMAELKLPPGARAKTHLHHGIETVAFVIEGEVEMHFGERLAEHLVARAGEFVYVPADMSHLVANRSGAPARALVAHSAADDQQGIVLLPVLDGLHP